MKRTRQFLFPAAIASVGLLTMANVAQEPASRPGGTRSKSAEAGKQPAPAAPEAERSPALDSVTVEKIMEQAVKNIARRYNLNEAQRKKTEELMKRDVNKFLREHEEEVWPLIRQLLSTGLRPPDNLEEVKRIGKAAGPLARLAYEAILDGNEEWRMYLTPEQKRLHDYDLAEMDKTFEQIDENFEKWAMGTPPDGSFFPAPTPPNAGPPRPIQPADEGLPPAEVEVFDPRTIFDTFVEEFIKDYDLDESQIVSARSILDEFKSKANDFRNTNKEKLATLAEGMKTALEDRDRKKMAELEEERKELLAPVYELFGRMEERLMALLTTAQRDRGKAQAREPEVRVVRERSTPKQKREDAERPKGSDGDDSK